MAIELVELGNVCEFLDSQRVPVEESERKLGKYPYYGATGQVGWIDGYIFDEPLVLLAEDGGPFCSKTEPIAYKIKGKSWVNNHAHVLRPRDNCDLDYLCHVLTFYDVTQYISGTTRKKLTKSRAEVMPIPLPSLPEQKRVAAILENADRLRRLRHYALELSDTYLQSVFLESFGDLKTNLSQYPIIPLGKVCDVRDGTHESPSYVQKGYPLVTSKNLVNGYVDLHDANFISKEDYVQINKRSKVDKGDILMPMIGTIGNPVLVDHIPNYAIKNVALIKFIGSSPRSLYIRELLRGYYFDFITSKSSRGGTQQFIALDDIRNFPIPVPSDEEQSKFNHIVQRSERLQSQQREAERQAEHLFQTLLHKAFDGELS